ncbi:ToMV susceptible protein tm-2 [Sesamum alatum]|uniref:ToMV susceptible protein tm-2 n=1 Tax=Sesamum alatum TaxID=300844 RepID=A0AAE1YC79_9LAMI|nr:ToMV susceptible protein tm-2 [Sesamum alatum]
MAYAAVVSLKLTIQRLLKSSQIPIPQPHLEIIELAYEKVKFLQELFTLEDGSNNERVKAVEREIREAACRLEDVLEQAHLSNDHFLSSQSQTLDRDFVVKVKEEIMFFMETVKKIKEQLRNLSLPDEDIAAITSRTNRFGGDKSKLFGLDDEAIEMENLLVSHFNKVQVVSIVGMAGIGKTTLVKKVYADIAHHFHLRSFISIGPRYGYREILQKILTDIRSWNQVRYRESNDDILDESDHILAIHLWRRLFQCKYLIVLDDIWDVKLWHWFKRYLADNRNGSRIIVTTRLEQVAEFAQSDKEFVLKKRFLNETESWHLLRETVFGLEKLSPPQLEEIGRKIAKKCEGLPLAVIVVGKHLSKAERTTEYWNKVVDKEYSVIINSDEELTKTLMLSYNYLPPHLKACFLYIGVFPHDYEIPVSELIKLWCGEGFLESSSAKSLENFAMECLGDLVSRSVVLVRQQSSSGRTKTCRAHSVFWHLCARVAGKERFFHVINSLENQGIESQRRLSIYNNALFGMKDVYQSMETVSKVRSLLCTGPHHQYPVPMSLGFHLLRVLDALTIRFYGFPDEVVKLVRLRYLAFTYNGKLPASISKLQNLQYLIVRQYLRILSSEAHGASLPMEIWDMQELRHLQVTGNNLPDPISEGALLPNLLTLLGISARSCTKEVLRRMPRLKKLGIQIELALGVVEPLCCFNHLPDPCGIESLKCGILNPKVGVPALPSVLIFPSDQKLTLSGLGFPWEYMSIIAKLSNLEVLKLRCYAFQGLKWEVYDYNFSRLKFLMLEDTNLEDWYAGNESFPSLERLIIGHCYKLNEIPLEFGDIKTLEMIEFVDCSPTLVASAKQLAEKRSNKRKIQICVKSSEDDVKLKSRLAP